MGPLLTDVAPVPDGKPNRNAVLGASDDIFLKDVLVFKAISTELPKIGRLVVNGYLVTRQFSVWIGDSKKAPAPSSTGPSLSPPDRIALI